MTIDQDMLEMPSTVGRHCSFQLGPKLRVVDVNLVLGPEHLEVMVDRLHGLLHVEAKATHLALQLEEIFNVSLHHVDLSTEFYDYLILTRLKLI